MSSIVRGAWRWMQPVILLEPHSLQKFIFRNNQVVQNVLTLNWTSSSTIHHQQKIHLQMLPLRAIGLVINCFEEKFLQGGRKNSYSAFAHKEENHLWSANEIKIFWISWCSLKVLDSQRNDIWIWNIRSKSAMIRTKSWFEPHQI